MKIPAILALLLAVLGSGCAIGLGKSVHQYALSESAELTGKEKQRPVEAEATQYVFLSFAFDTDFADEAYQKLLNSCHRGRLLNVRATHSTDLGFLAYRNRFRLAATCVE